MEELRSINGEKGQTLLEVLVALTAAVVVVYAITTAVISALSNAQFSKNQVLAAQYAQQGIEIMRQIRDSDWSKFSSYNETTSTLHYCLAKNIRELGSPQVNACEKNVDDFIREVQIQKNSPDCTQSSRVTNAAKITVTVSWSDGKCPSGNLYCHNAKLVSCFSDFQVVTTP